MNVKELSFLDSAETWIVITFNVLQYFLCRMFSRLGEQQTAASHVLTALKDHPEAWTRVDTVLSCSSNMNTKYYALQILQKVIQTRWKALPREQCDGWYW